VQLTDVDTVAAVTAPAEPDSAAPSEEEKEGDLTSLYLPGRLQAMKALDTLQRYLRECPDKPRVQTTLYT